MRRQIFRFSVAFGLAILGWLLGAATARAESLNEEALRALVIENTITGRYVFGGWFSEYHAADGRVLGNNGWQENQDACWTTKESAICYAYGEAKARQTYCFTIERQGESLLLRNLSDGALNAVAKMEARNPRDHSDAGKNWNCEDKVSRLKQGPIANSASPSGDGPS